MTTVEWKPKGYGIYFEKEEDNAKGIRYSCSTVNWAIYSYFMIKTRDTKTLSCWGMAWSASLGEMWGQDIAYSVVAIKLKQIASKNIRFCGV